MRILVLDDFKDRHVEFDRVLSKVKGVEIMHVRDSLSAIRKLRDEDRFDLVCIDFDLNDEIPPGLTQQEYDGGDGLDVAEFIQLHLDKVKYPRKILIHSQNPDGATTILTSLRPTRIPVVKREFESDMSWVVSILPEVA